MLCPNCKKELVEINGRYICSDCGKEVPASEVNVGSWGKIAAATVEPVAPGSAAITDYTAGSSEGDNYIADSSGQPPAPETVATETPAPSIPEPDVAVPENPVNSDASEMVVPISEAVAVSSVEPDVPTPEVSAPEIAAPNDIIADDYSPVEPPISEMGSTQPVEAVAPVSLVEEPVATDPLPAAEVPVPTDVPEAPPAAAIPYQPAPANEAMVPDPLYSATASQPNGGGMPNPQDFYEPSAATPQAMITPDVQVPVASENGALPMDPNIYRDPLYETPTQGTPQPDATTSANNFAPPSKNRMNLILVIGGVVLALLFLAGGVTAYFLLSSKAKVSNNNAVATPTSVDCDALTSASDKADCIKKNFAACSLASWTSTTKSTDGTTTNETKNEVLGQDESGCSVAITDTKNADANLQDQSMTCSLDTSLSYSDAIAKNSSTNCSGTLADQLYGAQPSTDDASGTSASQ